MIRINSTIILFIAILLFSCQENEKDEVVYTETFNIDELIDSPDSDDEFIQKYSDFIQSTMRIYDLPDSAIIESHSTLSTESTGLNQSIEFEFDYSEGTTNYFLLNSLTKFHDLNDMSTGWNLGEDSFWSSLLSDNLKKEQFTEFKNKTIHPIGEYSEYSEVPVGDDIMVIIHIRWRKLIVQYGQLIHPKMKDEFLDKVDEGFKGIKEVYSNVDDKKIDQLVDKSLDKLKDAGM